MTSGFMELMAWLLTTGDVHCCAGYPQVKRTPGALGNWATVITGPPPGTQERARPLHGRVWARWGTQSPTRSLPPTGCPSSSHLFLTAVQPCPVSRSHLPPGQAADLRSHLLNKRTLSFSCKLSQIIPDLVPTLFFQLAQSWF